MSRQYYSGESCPHMPHLYKTEAAHEAHNKNNKRYYERQVAKYGPKQFDSHAYPLRLRMQRLLATIRWRCANQSRYAGRGIKCLITADDLEFAWERDGADKMRRPSVDRKENDGHYEPDNIRFIELADNIRRGVQVRQSLHAKPATEGAI